MNKRALTVVALVLLGCVVLVAAATEDRGEIGRYQSSTTFWNDGAWIYVTVIDTTTGEIASQKRYDDSIYKKVKKK